MPRAVNPSHVEAARLRESGIEWSTALKKAKVPDTDFARRSVCRIMRESKAKADAKAKAERDDAAAELRAKRKGLKACETALHLLLARRDFERPLLKRACSNSSSSGGASSSSGGSCSSGGSSSSSSSGGGAARSTINSAVGLSAETPKIVVAVKAKLTVARRAVRELNKNKGRVKKQGQGMSKKLKSVREAGRRVCELEREVAGLKEAAAGREEDCRRTEEFFSVKRDYIKRGAPYDPVFEELVAPAMMAPGASGNVIGEVLRTCTLFFSLLLLVETYSLRHRVPS